MDVEITYLIKPLDKPNICFTFDLTKVEEEGLETLLAKEGIFNFVIIKKDVYFVEQ